MLPRKNSYAARTSGKIRSDCLHRDAGPVECHQSSQPAEQWVPTSEGLVHQPHPFDSSLSAPAYVPRGPIPLAPVRVPDAGANSLGQQVFNRLGGLLIGAPPQAPAMPECPSESTSHVGTIDRRSLAACADVPAAAPVLRGPLMFRFFRGRLPATAQTLLDRYQAGERRFAGASLRQADLRGARLSGADLSRADLTGADLSNAIIEKVLFVNADLTRANLSNAKCYGADFTGTILSQALLTDAQHCKVHGASHVFRGREEGIFASSSRVDEALVSSLVELIRALGSRVFIDVRSIVPGDKWRPTLTRALADASIVVVFWCAHSADSREVENEFRTRMGRASDHPVLLDDTPLYEPLSDYQWLDFRGTFASHDTSQTRKKFDETLADYHRPRQRLPDDEYIHHSVAPPPHIEEFERRDLEGARAQLARAVVAVIDVTAEQQFGGAN